MNITFPPSAPTFIDICNDARSNLVGGHAGPASACGGSSYSRTWQDGLLPAERRAHFRVSFTRTIAVLVIAGAPLGGAVALIASCTAL